MLERWLFAATFVIGAVCMTTRLARAWAASSRVGWRTRSRNARVYHAHPARRHTDVEGGRPNAAQPLATLLANAEWQPRPDYGEGVMVAYHMVYGPIAEALNWECSSCRPEVGWADWTRAQKDADGTITLHVECGHCGNQYVYDDTGDEIDE